MRDRYVLEEHVPNTFFRHYSIWDNVEDGFATINGKFAWGLTAAEAHDLLRAVGAVSPFPASNPTQAA